MMIYHNKIEIDKEDIYSLTDILNGNEWESGRQVSKFEREFAQYLGCKWAIATNSGSSALHLALIELGVSDDDEIILPAFVCPSLTDIVTLVKAKPVLADINITDYNISIIEVKKKISKRTKAIIIPHLFGTPAEIEPFLDLDIPIIEDCAHSIGAYINGKITGNFGHFGIFSFSGGKLLSTGQGGMIIGNSEKSYSNILSRIITRKSQSISPDNNNKHINYGRYGYQLSDMAAMLGLRQLKKLPSKIKKHKEIAIIYRETFKNNNISLVDHLSGISPVYQRFILRAQRDAKKIIRYFQSEGIGCQSLSSYSLPHYMGMNELYYKNTVEAAKTAWSIPINESLTEQEVEHISTVVKKYDQSRISMIGGMVY